MSELPPTPNPATAVNIPDYGDLTPEKMHAMEWPTYMGVYHQVLREFPEVGEPLAERVALHEARVPADPQLFNDTYLEQVAIPSQRLLRGVRTVFDLRSPPDKYPAISNFSKGARDILSAHSEDPEANQTPETALRLIKRACEYLEVKPEEYSFLIDYVKASDSAQSIQDTIRELAEERGTILETRDRKVQEYKRSHSQST